MKLRFSLLAILFASVAFAQHTVALTWQWSQGTGQPATQFNIMQSGAAGNCAQPVNTSICAQVGIAPPSATSFTTSPTTDPLVEGNTYCYVIVAQAANGILSVNSKEVCGVVKKTESAPTGVQATFN